MAMLCYLISFVLLIVGVSFFTGIAASYIKGYANLPEEEKKKIDIKGLCRNISVLFFIAAGIFLLAGYSDVFRERYFRWFMVVWFIACGIDLWFIHKSKRYENN